MTQHQPLFDAPDVKPVSPAEALANRKNVFPPQVIEAVNELLTLKYSGGSVTLLQKDVIEKILQRMPDLTKNDLFNNHFLDFEDLFEQNGWNVVYDKPAYYESYEPSWKFTPKRGHR